MSTCLPGLQGFPVQVNGWQSIPDKSQFVMPSDISLQFSPSKMPMAYQSGSFNINGTNTFFISGNQYFVRTVRLCEAKQEGLGKKSGSKAIAELHIWGLPTSTAKADNTIALLSIPIFQGPVNSSAGKVFLDLLSGRALQLQTILPVGNDIDVIRYTTCVETDKPVNISIIVAYWSDGSILTQDSLRALPTLQPFGVPELLPYPLVSSYVLTAGGKGGRTYENKNGIMNPYNTSINATDSDFIKGFRYIRGFNQQSIKDITDTSAYKCIAIDRSRDIKNGKLRVDPATGKRLSDDVKDANQQETADVPIYSPKYILEFIATIIGIIIGILLLCGLVYIIQYGLITRKSLGVPPVDPVTQQIAQRMGPQAGSN